MCAAHFKNAVEKKQDSSAQKLEAAIPLVQEALADVLSCQNLTEMRQASKA